MENLVSVVIPCFNQALFLPDAIQSIIAQTHQNLECIIINDGSTDNTDDVAKEWLKKDPRIYYYKKENGGLSQARNYGIERSNGNYIVTLDSDDKYEKTFIEKGIEILNNNLKTGIVSCWGIRFDKNKEYGLFQPNGKRLKDFLFNNAAIGTSMFRKNCWSEAGGYDESMKSGYEDWEFYIRVCKLDYQVHIIQEVLFYYRQHSQSMLKAAINNHDVEIKKYIFLKHAELYIENYPEMITHFLTVIDHRRKNIRKLEQSSEYLLGSYLNMPMKFLKKIFIRND